MGVVAMPSRPATALELAERLTGLVREASADAVGGEFPEPIRQQVADVVEALGRRVTRKTVRDPRSLFDLDDRLIALLDQVEEHAERGAAIPEELALEIDAYLEAYRQKVDRIAGYWRWQESIAAICGRESDRLLARKRAAENRVSRLKGFLLAFMTSRGIRKLDGELVTIGRQANSQAALVVDEPARIPGTYLEKSVRFNRADLEELIAMVPDGKVKTRLRCELPPAGWQINGSAVRSALANNEAVPGARLVKGEHVRLR